MTEQPSIPASIVKAICAIMTDLDAIPKTQRNQHGGYNYSSTDDIYAALTKKMGKVGLICIGLEESAEIVLREGKDNKQVAWLKAAYSFILATEKETWTHPSARRTVMLQVPGPQSFQGAQSFAEKSFLRSLFKLPTGDIDVDALPENFEYAALFSGPPVPPNDQTDEPTLTEEKFREWINEELILADNLDSLQSNWNDIVEAMEEMTLPRHYDDISNQIYQEHMTRITSVAEQAGNEPKKK